MKLNQTQAKEYDSRHIAVLAGCAYVFNSNLDDQALREVESTDFSQLSWQLDCKLLTIEGPSNKLLVRFGWLDQSLRFLRFKVPLQPSKHSSLELLRARAFDPVAFVSEHLSFPCLGDERLLLTGCHLQYLSCIC